ncbi:YdcF family protein [Crocosphaera sp. UHCC 0190]|uniref:YdcF family protein n=1 Tax=Crocosphaera sp. UHCC 0190 TaxID=3110246 RepID=UPI002B1EAE3C|nr:YdcF family protein [Crocosphaera sp. UHCC 0190]MEA5511380.1 YdcF family protein [Crocosphaera sp. UHCC 0190]
MPVSQLPPPKFWGILEYKPQWSLTPLGWVILLSIITLIMIVIATSIQPFLRVSRPIQADVMVLEGWVNDAVIKGAVAEFKAKNYQLMITTGTPISRGQQFSSYKTLAELAAATAIAWGLDPQSVVAVPTPVVKIDRTAASAIAVKQWLSQSELGVKAINLYSYDVHTRRSWFIFQQVLEPEIKVGAIAHPSRDYDVKQWWKSSAGAKSVILETIGYCYARLIWRNQLEIDLKTEKT